MSNNRSPEDPAFPNAGGKDWGLSRRELLAAMAMQGYISLEDQRTCPKDRINEVEIWRQEIVESDAKYCVRVADAVLAELSKEGGAK